MRTSLTLKLFKVKIKISTQQSISEAKFITNVKNIEGSKNKCKCSGFDIFN